MYAGALYSALMATTLQLPPPAEADSVDESTDDESSDSESESSDEDY